MQVDVVVIGAGAAGIGAGQALQAQGRSFVIVEAADRVGGRAYTDRTSLPDPWDQGCHWFHCADVNPLVPWGERLGADFEREDRIDTGLMWADGDWLSAAAMAESQAAMNEAFAAIYDAAARGLDTSLDTVLPSSGPWAPRIRSIARLMASGDPADVSVSGYGDYADTEVNYVVRSGLGDLIERMAKGLPIRLKTAVTAVEQRPNGVRVVTDAGAIEARSAIVTVSTNVLAAGVIRFDAPEAQPVLDRIADVPCGAYEKIAIALRRLPVDPGDAQFCWIDPGKGQPLNFEFAPTPTPILIAHVGGSDARALVAAGREAMIDLAVERLVDAFGSAIRADVTHSEVTGWLKNPLIRGAYSHAKPGLADRRREMIAAETGDVIFAGEAFSLHWEATAHGAWQTGQTAAMRASARIG